MDIKLVCEKLSDRFIVVCDGERPSIFRVLCVSPEHKIEDVLKLLEDTKDNFIDNNIKYTVDDIINMIPPAMLVINTVDFLTWKV